jgi:hypothetical protein
MIPAASDAARREAAKQQSKGNGAYHQLPIIKLDLHHLELIIRVLKLEQAQHGLKGTVNQIRMQSMHRSYLA